MYSASCAVIGETAARSRDRTDGGGDGVGVPCDSAASAEVMMPTGKMFDRRAAPLALMSVRRWRSGSDFIVSSPRHLVESS
jgi:hypothetical protein